MRRGRLRRRCEGLWRCGCSSGLLGFERCHSGGRLIIRHGIAFEIERDHDHRVLLDFPAVVCGHAQRALALEFSLVVAHFDAGHPCASATLDADVDSLLGAERRQRLGKPLLDLSFGAGIVEGLWHVTRGDRPID